MNDVDEGVRLVAAVVGFIAFGLLWVTVVLGFVLRTGRGLTRVKPPTVLAIHQTLALLGLCLVVVHACTFYADPDTSLRIIDAIVPFTNTSDPIGIGIGVIAVELMVAASLSLLIQRRLGYTRWRAVHGSAYFAFMLVVAHVLVASQRSDPSPVWAAVVACWLVTVVLWVASRVGSAALPPAVTPLQLPARRRFERPGGSATAVDVDTRRCAQFGFCEQEAPNVFVLRGGRRLAYRAHVTGEHVEEAIRAAQVCPVRAITLNEVLIPPRDPRSVTSRHITR